MAKKSVRQSKVQKQKEKQKEDVKAARHERAQEETEQAKEKQQSIREARKVRAEALHDARREQSMADVERENAAAEEAAMDEPDPVLLDGKPGSGAGLKPGDYFAPASNPGASARVPSQPLQPESLQSHGKGIIYDKDIDNPPYGTNDPEAVDASPAGLDPDLVDKDAEVEKAKSMTSRAKMHDPDNPTIGYRGADATASPLPIGRRRASKSDIAGGSNSGVDR